MARMATPLMALLLSSLVIACGGSGAEDDDASDSDGNDATSGQPPECSTDADCAGRPDSPICDTANEVCHRPLGWQIGMRDGSPTSVAIVPVWEPDKHRGPTDLQFNPSKPTELWVVNRSDDSAIIIQNPGTPEMTWERRRDPAADHFMKQPPAISFGVVLPEWGQTFAVCGDDDQGGGSAVDFIGPALFSADLTIFAEPTPTGLGSHLDMLHSTSFCRGIEHVVDNVYFAFNAQKNAIDRYDFKADHGPGNDDHSDGEILRYVEGAVLGGNDDVPSHLAYDATDGQLYIADSGHGRIAKLDTNTGTMGAEFSGFEPVPVRNSIQDAVIVDVVPPGTLLVPTGLELHEDILFVSDIGTSRFHAFDKTGKPLRTLDTGIAPGSLVGFTFGPDGKVYFVDRLTSRVFRIDPL
jgi:hypothetical protein